MVLGDELQSIMLTVTTPVQRAGRATAILDVGRWQQISLCRFSTLLRQQEPK